MNVMLGPKGVLKFVLKAVFRGVRRAKGLTSKMISFLLRERIVLSLSELQSKSSTHIRI
ncbi:MAG: hypothetical protein O3C00_01715 [Bacteroidetes bacterium]|nr:hypothetical protein [Bacteroidota bacterium]